MPVKVGLRFVSTMPGEVSAVNCLMMLMLVWYVSSLEDSTEKVISQLLTVAKSMNELVTDTVVITNDDTVVILTFMYLM